MSERSYIAIDLKSFYASVECRQRGLNPLTTNLVVADSSRTEKTICLAVSPSLKAYGIPGRARLFEVVERVKAVNAQRLRHAPGGAFTGESYDDPTLQTSPELALSYITAPPQMARYIQCSTEIYDIYLKFVAPEDIHVYSIDEVFIDATPYLSVYRCTARELARRMMQEVFRVTGITATAGVGTNLYLCKVAMDIVAKHIPPDADGARIAELDEERYRRLLWTHRPLTDFWRVGRGYAKKLEEQGIYTMGDVARCSLGKPEDYYNEALLYKLFGVNGGLLIDHAWGWEPCRISDIKAYKPQTNSLGSGQVLKTPYPADKARLVVREMTELLTLDLVDKGLVTDQVVLTVGYDIENLTRPEIAKTYRGAVTQDAYGRKIPKHAHGTARLPEATASGRKIMEAMLALYDRIVNPRLLVRRVNITAAQVKPEQKETPPAAAAQMTLFSDEQAAQAQQEEEEAALAREKQMQQAVLSIKKKYGKNAILKGTNLEEGATAMERNQQIGGHKA